jgi:acetyl-CoA acetyltransferase
MSERDAVIVGYARTPIGKFGSAYASLTAMELGGHAIAGALERAGVEPGQVDQVVMGHVLQAGQGQITARQAARKAGIGLDVPALTVNKVCLSGMTAVALADQWIRLGEADVVVAGGMESMSQAPYLLPKARFGYRMGSGEVGRSGADPRRVSARSNASGCSLIQRRSNIMTLSLLRLETAVIASAPRHRPQFPRATSTGGENRPERTLRKANHGSS